MTLSPEEALTDLKKQERARKAQLTPLGSSIAGLVLVAVSGFVAFYAVVNHQLHPNGKLLGALLVLALAVLGSSAISTGKARGNDGPYGIHYVACLAVTALVTAVLCVLAVVQDMTWARALLTSLFLLVAPVVASLSFLAVRASHRR